MKIKYKFVILKNKIDMGITRLKRKGRVNRLVVRLRKQSIKLLTAVPVIKRPTESAE